MNDDEEEQTKKMDELFLMIFQEKENINFWTGGTVRPLSIHFNDGSCLKFSRNFSCPAWDAHIWLLLRALRNCNPSKEKKFSVRSLLAGLSLLTVTACAHSQSPLLTQHTAPEIYASLSGSNKEYFGRAYELGRADQIKNLYWKQHSVSRYERTARQSEGKGEAQAEDASLKTTYENVWIPAQEQPDRTQTVGHWVVISEVK